MEVLLPLTPEEFTAYAAESVRSFAAEKARAGQWPRGEAFSLAKKTLGQLLPQGLSTPGHWVFKVLDGEGRKVGVLWMERQKHGGQDIAYVYDIAIDPEHRRRGHARRALAAVEAKAREMGLAGVALHVFGHNEVARALYEKLGFKANSIHMVKPLEP